MPSRKHRCPVSTSAGSVGDTASPVEADEFDGLMAALGPFGPAPRIAVGVSGGPHSLALALIARGWAERRGGTALALIVDHGLRDGSEAEARVAAAVLAGLGSAARVLSLGLPAGASLHERARSARLAALLDAAAEAGAPWLLLGHHRADQAETVAFRAARGSGPDGLAGMAAARAAAGAVILRPLLSIPPARLEATLARAGLRPLRDPSNDDLRFARARLRVALADRDGTGPGTTALAGAASLLGDRRVARSAVVAARIAACAAFRPGGWVRLDRVALGTDAVAIAALGAMLRAVAGAEHRPARDAVERMLARGGGTLGGALWRGAVLCREPAAVAPPVPAAPGARWDGRWRVLSAPEGGVLGALHALDEGAIPAARAGWPAAVLAALPAIRHPGGMDVPALGIGASRLAHEPAAGPIA